jgi:uncharacterized YigZ family protein
MFTLIAPVQVENEIRKSRFIGYLMPVTGREAAMAELGALREQHRAATHVCWALLAGGQSGMSDDGEPAGTAGRPIIEVLRHHDLEGVLAAVVRYYGGVKLGAGGLVRAYADTTAAALKLAQLAPHVAQAELVVEVDYADEARVRRWLEQHECLLLDSMHGMTVMLRARVPQADADAMRDALISLTHGRARFPAGT